MSVAPVSTTPPAAAGLNPTRTVGCFLRQGQSFGMEVSFLREVVHTRQLTPVPAAASFLAGIMNLRGEILPVLLIDALLGLPPEAFAPHKPILVVRRKNFLAGIQVDVVERVESLPLDDILPNPLAVRHAHLAALHHSFTHRRLTTLIDAPALVDQITRDMTGTLST